MQKLKQLLTIIDKDYIKDNPDTAYELIEALIVEYYQMKDVIEMQREELLLLKAMTVNP